jgi:hypothetical protein
MYYDRRRMIFQPDPPILSEEIRGEKNRVHPCEDWRDRCKRMIDRRMKPPPYWK